MRLVCVDWIGMVKDRDNWRTIVNAAMNLWVLLNAGKLSGYTADGLVSSAQLHTIGCSVVFSPKYICVCCKEVLN
jgi:hypothetical protein